MSPAGGRSVLICLEGDSPGRLPSTRYQRICAVRGQGPAGTAAHGTPVGAPYRASGLANSPPAVPAENLWSDLSWSRLSRLSARRLRTAARPRVVVLLLRRRVTDLEACDWLVRPQGALGNRSPLVWLTAGHSLKSVVAALPEATRPLPAGAARPGREEMRRAWLHFKHGQATPGLEVDWDELARTREAAYPLGI